MDMSRTYLGWGKENFDLNGLDSSQHAFVQADVLQWLGDCSQQYDLIFMDPPTFSNSKRMEGVLDIQRDHVGLIQQAVACLKPGGTLVFSTNMRKFTMEDQA
ncbi:class I SAM-dependent methyltransferase, partial [Gilvimarinus sp. 1_MG-2023]|uniref:class I SAM-dependent methyltransferase n=1 Tax=Gilvimarinus sp. 1_MG-2023 TaxID=3062638 RepID=UPI0026E22EFE